MKALIVDDNSQNVYLLQALLGGHGFATAGANHGLHARELLRREPFQVIVADILMPQMDGFQLCREVKTDPELRHIPFIFYTATYTSAEDEAFARGLGAEAFIVKPMEPADFLAAVLAILGRRGHDTPAGAAPAVELETVDYFRQYNVRLIQKLEQKLLQLEEANRELQRSENRFQTLAQAAPVGIFHVSQAGEPDFVNDRWCAITGIPREAASVSAWHAAVHVEDRERVVGEWKRALDQGNVFQSEFRIRKSDGEVSWVLGQASPLPEQPGPYFPFVGTFTDVTRQKQLEQERAEIQAKLHQSQKLEAIGTLVNGISHDFNNLVGAIFGYAELAQREMNQEQNVGTDLKLLILAAERAKSLTGQILRFSRREKEEHRPVQIGPVVREVMQLLRLSMPDNIRCEESVKEGLPAVLADATQIHQVAMNLVSNAVYAMRENGGELSVKVETARVGPARAHPSPDLPEGKYVVLRVRDTGCGIPPDLQSKIFDPFFTTKPPGEGTGMGLSVVHGIVKSHGGAFALASEPGMGTTFTVYLPAVAEPEPAPAAEPAVPPQGRGQRILCVDNERLLTSMIKRMLEILGYQATAFADAEEALECVRAHPSEFDLLISDVDMPKFHGAEFARRVWELNADLPILFVSGVSETLSCADALQMGAREMLMKPFDLRALGEAVAKALSEKAACAR